MAECFEGVTFLGEKVNPGKSRTVVGDGENVLFLTA